MYDIIDNPTIENLVPAAVKMTMFVHDTKTDLVVVGGSSAQNAAYMVKQIWQKFYHQEKMPMFVASGMVVRKKKVSVIKEGKKLILKIICLTMFLKKYQNKKGQKLLNLIALIE